MRNYARCRAHPCKHSDVKGTPQPAVPCSPSGAQSSRVWSSQINQHGKSDSFTPNRPSSNSRLSISHLD
eukprot:4309-Eustigmatos_ZCMA.PRE.1